MQKQSLILDDILPSNEDWPTSKVMDAIYDAYPRKVEKKRAIDQLRKSLINEWNSGSFASQVEVTDWMLAQTVAFARAMKALGKGKSFIKYPKTFFGSRGRDYAEVESYVDEDRVQASAQARSVMEMMGWAK